MLALSAQAGMGRLRAVQPGHRVSIEEIHTLTLASVETCEEGPVVPPLSSVLGACFIQMNGSELLAVPVRPRGSARVTELWVSVRAHDAITSTALPVLATGGANVTGAVRRPMPRAARPLKEAIRAQ